MPYLKSTVHSNQQWVILILPHATVFIMLLLYLWEVGNHGRNAEEIGGTQEAILKTVIPSKTKKCNVSSSFYLNMSMYAHM